MYVVSRSSVGKSMNLNGCSGRVVDGMAAIIWVGDRLDAE